MRALLALPFLAACAHTPLPCEWPRTCEERRDAVQADARPTSPPKADKPADPKPEKNHSRDDNGDSSDDNGGKSDD